MWPGPEDERNRHLHRALGYLMTDGAVSVDQRIILGPRSISALQDQLRTLPYDFTDLQTFHEGLRDTKIIDLSARLHDLSTGGDSDWLNRAYEAVLEATDNPAEYTPPLDNLGSMMLLCYVPEVSRRLTRRLVQGNAIVAHMRASTGPDADPATREVIAAIGAYYRADALVGQQWTSQPGIENLTQMHALRMAQASSEKLAALATVERVIKQGNGQMAADAWETAVTAIEEALTAVDEDSPLEIWQRTDRGHAFGIYHSILQDKLRSYGSGTRSEYDHPPKTSMAAILEDDTEQLAAWRRTLEAHTEYMPNDDLCFTDVEAITAAADQNDIGLYLLDIQNGDDLTAGIRAGEAILNKLLSRLEGVSLDGALEQPQVRIIVWSSSEQSLNDANAHFRTILKNLDEPTRNFIRRRVKDDKGGYDSAPIMLEVRRKGWDEITDIPHHRM